MTAPTRISPGASILGVDWAPASTIARRAEGSDNWPTTGGDDDALYTAYGDGRGFAPPAPRKLGLGLARVVGPPEDFRGLNIPSPSCSPVGDGMLRPRKSSGGPTTLARPRPSLRGAGGAKPRPSP